jgi:hypothetical protein
MPLLFRKLLFSTLLLGSTAVQAQKRIYVNEYLNIGTGGRGLAMGGAQAATTNDIFSPYYNPAGLLQIRDDYQIGGMHADYFSGNAKYDFAGVAMPLKDKKRVLAVSAIRFAVDDIPYTIDYVQPDGSFDESKLKSLTAGDYAFLVSYAQGLRLFKDTAWHTRLGGNAKILYRHLGSMATAWGVGIDLGLQASYKRWQFGIMAKDITTTVTSWSFNLSEREKQVFGQTGNEIPVKSYEVMYPRFNFGIARTLTRPGKPFQLMAEIDADLTTDGRRNTLVQGSSWSLDPHAGLEASYKNVVFVRAGIGNIQRALDDADTANQKKITLYQPSFGVGLFISKTLSIDYAYTSLQSQKNPLFTHIVSARISVQAPHRRKPVTTGTPGQ